MANTVKVQIVGLRELGAALLAYPEKYQRKVAAKSTGKGANIFKKRVKGRIEHNDSKDGDSVDTGSLRDALIVKKIPKSQTPLASEHIVTFRGRGKPKVNKKGVKQAQAPHAHLTEFGTVNQPPEPNMRQGFDGGVDEAQATMVDILRKGVEA